MRPRVVEQPLRAWARVFGRMKDTHPFAGRAAITSRHDVHLDLRYVSV